MIRLCSKGFVQLFAILFFIVSCQEDTDFSNYNSHDFNLIFGKRMLWQTRSLLMETDKKINNGDLFSAFEYGSAALAARTSAGLFVSIDDCNPSTLELVDLADPFVHCDCLPNFSLASGNLTSPSRIATVMHAVLTSTGNLYEESFREKCSIGAAFDSNINVLKLSIIKNELNSGTPYDSVAVQENFQGSFVSDYHPNWNFAVDDFPDVDYEGIPNRVRSESIKENPLFANRLYAMGLESWAHLSNYTTRQYLRSGWMFSVANESIGNVTNDYNDNPGRLEKYTINKDIAFLDACKFDDVSLKIQYPYSGKFALERPGIFFDYVGMINLDSSSLTDLISQSSSIFSSSQSYYPTTDLSFSSPGSFNLNLEDISKVSVVDGPRGILGSKDVSYTSYACNAETGDRIVAIYHSLRFKTNFDALTGSSGSNIFIKSAGDDRKFDGFLRSFAILDSVFVDKDDTNLHRVAWGLGVPMTGDFPYASPKNEEYVTYITGVDKENKIMSKYDLSIDPSNPIPLLGDNEINHLPECLVEIEDGQCIEYGGKLLKNDICSANDVCPPENIPTLFVNPNYINDFAEDISISTDAGKKYGPPTFQSSEGYRLSCDSWFFKQNKSSDQGVGPGVAIGFVGAQSHMSEYPYLVSQGTTVLGSLRIICAPWTFRPFTDNWQFLFWVGRKSIDNIKSINDSLVDFLSRGLVTSFEQREVFLNKNGLNEIGTITRPISMKTCPPNYLLNGFNVIYDSVNEKNYVVGIESLICVNTNKKSIDKIKICLNPLNNIDGGCQTNNLDWSAAEDFYSLNYENPENTIKIPFSLSQEIGQNVKSSGQKISPVTCGSDDQIVNNIFIDAKDKEVIRNIFVGCITRPYPH